MNAEIVSEIKNGCVIYYYPGASVEGGRNGVIVSFESAQGLTWQGIFAYGDVSPNGISGLFHLPLSDKYCIASRGAGYVVSAIDPSDWEAIDSVPILDVIVLDNLQMIVFIDYTGLIAYNHSGIVWKSESLVPDGFKLISVKDSILTGECFVTNRVFTVDLSTGTSG